jgi:WD40 repeat protein
MIIAERLDRALAGTPRVVGLVGPPGPDRTALARAYCERPEVAHRFRDGIGWISLGEPVPAPDWMPWADTPDAARLVRQAAPLLRRWSAVEPVAPERAAAALGRAGHGRLIVVDDVRTAGQVGFFEDFAEHGRLLMITEQVSLLPPGAVVVWASTAGHPVPAEAEELPEPPPVIDLPWITRRLAEDGATGLAVDLALAGMSGEDHAVVALARSLRASGEHFSGVRAPRALSTLAANLLDGLPPGAVSTESPGAVSTESPGAVSTEPPVPLSRWPLPGRFGSALIRRLLDDRPLVDVAVTDDVVWTATGAASADAGGPADTGGSAVTCWDPFEGRRLFRLTFDGLRATGLLPSPDASWLAVTIRSRKASGVRLIDTGTGEVRGTIPGSVAAAAPDGSWFAAGDHRGEVRVHDAVTLEQLRLVAAHWAPVTALAAAPDGSWLASASEDGTIRITDVSTGRPRRAVAVSKVTAMVAGAGWLAAAGPYGVHLIDPARGADRRIHPGGGALRALTVAGDGSWLAVAYEDQDVLLFDGAGELRHRFPAGSPHTRLAAAPDGSWLAAGYPMRLWDARTGVRLPGFPAGAWSSRAVSPDGTWAVAHTGSDLAVLDLTSILAALADPALTDPALTGPALTGPALTGPALAGPALAGPALAGPALAGPALADPALADPVGELTVAADGSWLATRAPDGEIRFRDAADGRLLPVPPADVRFGDAQLTAVSPDGRWLATVDRTVPGTPRLRVTDRDTTEEMALLPAPDQPRGCRWSDDGAALFAWGEGGVHGYTWLTR